MASQNNYQIIILAGLLFFVWIISQISLILINQIMRKIGQEIRFQQTANFIQRELDTIVKNPTFAKLENIEPQLKKLDKTISKIEETLMSDRKLNRTDIKKKIDGYKQERNQIRKTFEDIRFRVEKAQLIKRPAENKIGGNLQNFKVIDDLNERNKIIEREFVETADIIQNTRNELRNQRQNIEALEQQWQDADVQLTMIDQFMRMISNRTLLTKVILILLALFLGLADITIIFLKIR